MQIQMQFHKTNFIYKTDQSFNGFSNQPIPNNPLASYNFTTSWDKQKKKKKTRKVVLFKNW